MEDLGFEARNAVKRSIELVKVGRREKALDLLDRYLEQATQENQNDVILLLSRHAEVLATAGGELQRVKRYAGQRLGRVADYSFQLYNYARLLLRLGEVEEARSRAAEAYELTRTQKTQGDQDLARAILEQWPDLGESPNEPAVTQVATQNSPLSAPAALGWSRLPAAYAIPATPPSLAEARDYCARLARTHYENFSVATWFLPRHLRQHFFNVYAYCRISDDLGDEVGDTAASLALLDQWQSELDACYHGAPKHPVFVALAETVRQFQIPQHEFSDLLIAFRQDQTVTRFETFNDVLAYCHYSANPVGHLVLYLCGYRDPERQQLSDFTCTALQLANFWQDVSVDYEKGRIYLPLEDLRRFGVAEDDIAHQQNTAAFRGMMKSEVERARDWFRQGLPLIGKVNRELAIDLELFSRGGQEILRAIERQDYAVLGSRPAISKPRKLALVARAALGKFLGSKGGKS